MQTGRYRSLGFKELPFQEASSVEEYDQLAAEVGACLKSGNSNAIYRGSMATFRDAFLHGSDGTDTSGVTFDGVEKLTGVDRKTKEVLDKEGKPKTKDGSPVLAYDESEDTFWDRVIASLVESKQFTNEDAVIAHFADAAAKLSAAVPLDLKRAERKAVAPKRLAKKYKDTAARILAAGTVDKFNVNNLEPAGISVFTPSGDETKMYSTSFEKIDPVTRKGTGQTETVNVSDKDAEALGWLVKQWSDWREQQQLATVG